VILQKQFITVSGTFAGNVADPQVLLASNGIISDRVWIHVWCVSCTLSALVILQLYSSYSDRLNTF